MNLSKAREDFIKYKKNEGLAPDSIRTYDFALRRFVAFVALQTNGREASLSFTADMVDDFFQHLSSNGYKRKSIAGVQTALREFSKWGQRKHYWRTDVMVEVRAVRFPRTLPRPFTVDERTRLMDLVFTDDDDTGLRALLCLGLRRKECSELTVASVIPPQATPTGYTLAHLRIKGKGDVERYVPIAPEFWPVIEKLALNRVEGFLLRDRYDSQMSKRAINVRVKRWGVRASVLNCTPHRWRHVFATKMLNATNNLRVVQELMGHASPTTTAIYTQVVSQQREDAIRSAFPESPSTTSTDYTHPAESAGSEIGAAREAASDREDWEGYA